MTTPMTDEREVDRYDIALDVIDAAIDELKPEAKRLALWAWTGIRKLLPEPSPDSVAIIAARLAQADAGAAVPEGWQLVPIEPVDAQFEAALRLQGEDAAIASAPALLSALLKIYRAMLAAAPKPEDAGAAVPEVTDFDVELTEYGMAIATFPPSKLDIKTRHNWLLSMYAKALASAPEAPHEG